MLRPAVCLLSAALLAACQSAPGASGPRGIAAYADDPRLGEQTDRICFASSIDGFSMNRDHTVVLREGSREYMVEVFGACPELRYAMTIGIDAVTGCLTRGDHLIVSSSLGGTDPTAIGPNRCMIKEMYKWDPKAKTPEDNSAED